MGWVRRRPGRIPTCLPSDCPKANASSDQTFRWVDDMGGKEGLAELSLKPMSGRRRVAIIEAAEAMNDESANSMLKTLEEPPPDSVLILIATSADLLLPTIRSRCQVVAFQPLAAADVRQLLLREAVTADEREAGHAAALSGGSLDAARQFLDTELRNRCEEEYNLLAAHPFRTPQSAARMIECLEPAGSENCHSASTRRVDDPLLRRVLPSGELTITRGEATGAGAIPQVDIHRTARPPGRGCQRPSHRADRTMSRRRAAHRRQRGDPVVPGVAV